MADEARRLATGYVPPKCWEWIADKTEKGLREYVRGERKNLVIFMSHGPCSELSAMEFENAMGRLRLGGLQVDGHYRLRLGLHVQTRIEIGIPKQNNKRAISQSLSCPFPRKCL